MPNIAGLYQGLTFQAFSPNDSYVGAVDLAIQGITFLGFQNKLIGLFYFPMKFLTVGEGNVITNTTSIRVVRTVQQPTNWNGFVPHNKKLYTYPYMFLTVDALQQEKSYKWEKSTYTVDATGLKELVFGFYGALSLNPAILCVPRYEISTDNMTEAFAVNFTDGLSAYSNCLFQLFGDNGLVNKLGNIALNTALSFANPNLAIAGMSATKSAQIAKAHAFNTSISDGHTSKIENVRNREGTVETYGTDKFARQRAENEIVMTAGTRLINAVEPQMAGTRMRGGGGNYDYITGKQDFYFKCMGIKEEFARKIDKFFDAYGYAVNTIKVPAIHNRPKWTYVRTKGCVVKGNIPDHYRTEICDTFDSGIRFWAVGAGGNVDIGNYNQDNSPQSE